jgi:hypothetical protein
MIFSSVDLPAPLADDRDPLVTADARLRSAKEAFAATAEVADADQCPSPSAANVMRGEIAGGSRWAMTLLLGSWGQGVNCTRAAGVKADSSHSIEVSSI